MSAHGARRRLWRGTNGIWCAFAAILLACRAAAPLAAMPDSEAEHAEPHIQVIAESWYPYSYEENGVVLGRATATVRKVMERAGFDYDIALYPWPRAYRMAQERENLLVSAMVKTPEREQAFQFVGQVMEGDRLYFFGIKGRADIKLAQADDAKAFRIATSQDSAMMDYLVAHEFPDVQPLFDIRLGFKQLRYGRIDLLLTSAVNVAAHVRTGDIEPGSVVPYVWAFDAAPHMAFSAQTSPQVVARTREAYESLVKEGQIPVFGAQPFCGMDVLTSGLQQGCGADGDGGKGGDR